jgi:competence CoiA-like predicted nuclease
LRFQRQAVSGTIFSHHAKGNCASAGESPEHIYIKTLIAKAVIDAGWRAITESRGASPSESQWAADVYCTKDEEARVIDVQLSGQSPEEFNRRQRMYIESGVKSLWLASRFNRNRLIPSLELPVFELGLFRPRMARSIEFRA